METSDQIIKLRQAICDYYKIEYELLDSKSRKMPIPFIKKIISYFAAEYLSITQSKIARHFGFKDHSNVNTHIFTFKEILQVNKRLQREVKELEKILIEIGIWSGRIENRKYYTFIDLNNCIVASLNKKQTIFVNQSEEEIKEMLGEEWDIEVHENTNKMFYTLINKPPKNK